ncbi:hypothetical protein FHS55_000682 [Angulomicrobium tetraedrale]|uniref:DUF4268 domain-containing protein n=1 Tax=Ancylobacter tetraedralis TaxID=217068 RepID=A0A839Z6U7_9HYPH|nr:DUF4268 domain-containing protein [Ancylobacter tetraedralis]MBB3770096.1 hypothetical protein [Ancylobacter tetraedralis]
MNDDGKGKTFRSRGLPTSDWTRRQEARYVILLPSRAEIARGDRAPHAPTAIQDSPVSRQHARPVLIRDNLPAISLAPVTLGSGDGAISEADIQQLVHEHPSMLPIAEIDPAFQNPVAICRELRTTAGAIDNFLVTPGGMPVIVECKLWRNPEGRREVVGQILDYAKELSRWSQSDVQREVNIRLGTTGNVLLEKVRSVAPETDEIGFNDALTANLRRGRFLLLIVGDGIREGVEAIAEYLQRHAGLHFSFGLVELPFFRLPDGSRLVAPRILARTVNVVRHVVALPEGMAITDGVTDDEATETTDPDVTELAAKRQQFWKEFLSVLKLDDPEQRIPNPSRRGYLNFMLPAPSGSSWLCVYREMKDSRVGVFLASTRDSAGEYAEQRLESEWSEIQPLLGGSAKIQTGSYERGHIGDARVFGDLNNSEVRQQAFAWLAERTNTFVNVLRPRVRSAVADYEANQGA